MDKELLKRYFEQKASKEEKTQVENWILNSDGEELLAYIELEYALESNELPVKPFNEMFDNIKIKKAAPSRVITLKNKWVRVAAAACVLFLLGGWVGYFFTGNAALHEQQEWVMDNGWVMNTAKTNYGQYAQLTLSDGSEVYLKGNSKISFPEKMNLHPVVFLEGEAYFNVQDKTRGLTVKTKDLVTTAKDSKFNISAFSKDSVVTVVVESGKAEVHKNNEFFPLIKLRFINKDSQNIGKKIVPWVKVTPALIIKKNEKGVYDKITKQTDISELKPGVIPLIKLLPVQILRDKINQEVQKVNSVGFTFCDAGFTEIIKKLEDNYDLNIESEISENQLPLYSGVFKKGLTIGEVLNQVCYSLELEYKVFGDKIIIKKLK